MRRRNNKMGSILFMLVFIGAIALSVFVAFSPMFERVAPSIALEHTGYWNLKTPLHATLSDASGIRSYSVTLIQGKERIVLASQQFEKPQTSIEFEIEAPKKIMAFKPESVTLEITAHDGSKWNILSGNEARYTEMLNVDMKAPQISIVANSSYLYKGGSGIVVFRAEEENLKSLSIETNFGKTFIPQPFYKEGFYISLVAWKVTEPSFKAQVVATDLAGNVRKSTIPYRTNSRKYRISKIKLSDSFLEGKIAELAETFDIASQSNERIEQFKIINEDVRAKNENLIHKVTSHVDSEAVDSLTIKPFYPLKNAKKVASFGDRRLYYYGGTKVSESYHLGIDLASIKMGEIRTQNPGKVVFSDFNGLYGNMPAIHHGLGLYTIYGHCSSTAVAADDNVASGELVANTGMSGYAMGDHLHFGVLVQGIEVRPEEWMDPKWLQLNIYDTIRDAKKIIDRQQ